MCIHAVTHTYAPMCESSAARFLFPPTSWYWLITLKCLCHWHTAPHCKYRHQSFQDGIGLTQLMLHPGVLFSSKKQKQNKLLSLDQLYFFNPFKLFTPLSKKKKKRKKEKKAQLSRWHKGHSKKTKTKYLPALLFGSWHQKQRLFLKKFLALMGEYSILPTCRGWGYHLV